LPSQQEHLVQARHNEALAAVVLRASPRHADWAVVATFYAALHYAEAYLASQGLHSPNHAARAQSMKRLMPALSAPLDDLKDAADRARYRCIPQSPRGYRKNCAPKLAIVRDVVQRALKEPRRS
jgi:hypothetical protein